MSDTAKWMFVDRALALMTLSSATCVVYDHLTTLDDEIELIWKRPKWSVVQFLFFINRYVGDGLQIFNEAYSEGFDRGHLLKVLIGFFATVTLGTMQGIMSYRVSSMYGHSHKIIILLIAAFTLELSLMLVVQGLAIFGKFTAIPEPAPGVRLCTEGAFPTWLYTLWIPIILFELLVLTLSISLAVKYYLESRLARSNNIESRKSLRYILLRDSITFPFIGAIMAILNLITWSHSTYLVKQFTFLLSTFFPIIIGPRLVLNLREAYYQPFIEELEPEMSLRFYDSTTHSQ